MKSRVFNKYIISYILVLVIPVILIGALNYGRFVEILTEEVTNSAKGLLCQIRDVADVNIKEITTISYVINKKQNIHRMYSRQKDDKGSIYPDIYNYVNELRGYKISNSMIDHILLYLKNSDTVISDLRTQDFDSEFGWSYIYKDISSKELKQRLDNVKNTAVWPSMKVNDGNGSKAVVTYISSMPIGSAKPKATLIVTINDLVFRQIISNVFNEYSSTVLMLDSDKNILFDIKSPNMTIDSSKIKSIINDLGKKKVENYTEVTNGLLITYVKSEDTGWYYTAIIPSDQIFDKVNYLKTRLIIILVITMLVGIAISYFFSKGNYINVKRITDIITEGHRSNSAEGKYRNEWEYINKAVSGYVIENASLQQKLFDQMPVLRNSYLRKLINGNFKDTETINSMLNFLNIELKQKQLAIFLISIDNYITFINMHNELEQGIIRVALSEAIEKVFNSTGSGYAVEMEDEKIAVLFDAAAETIIDAEILKGIGCKMRDYVIANFDFSITVGISAICENILDLRNAYIEACETIDYKMVKGENSVICYCDIKQKENSRKFYSYKQEDQIINFLRLGEYESINDILKEVVDNVKNESVSINIGKCTYLEIINTAIKASDELGFDSSIIEQNLPSLVQQETIDGVCREVARFYKDICRQANNAKSLKTIDLVKRVLEYVNNFYADKSISVEQVARECSISPSYFSHFFKEQIGSSLLDYLHNIRLTKAKEFLRATEESVADIADKVGYNSVHNFIRVFKRYENITPSEYRQK